MILQQSQVASAIINTLQAWGFWSAIVATIAVILLGWLLAWKNILKKEWDKVFIKAVMVVGLPSLALNGFLADITLENLKSEAFVLLIGFLFYTVMCLGSKIFFLKYEKDIQDTLAMCIALASTTFFGIPIVTALFPSSGKIPSNIFNVPYRVFLYSLAFAIMSKKHLSVSVTSGEVAPKIMIPSKTEDPDGYATYMAERKATRIKNVKQIFLNPILIATFIGLIIWATQLIPGIECIKYSGVNSGKAFSPLRIDLLFPPIGKILTVLTGICTPLAWLAIGIQLSKGDIKKAVRNKTVWYASTIKVVVAPLIILGLSVLIAFIAYQIAGKAQMSMADLGALVIMTAAPPASVVVSYAIAYDKEPELASNLTLVSTILAIVTLPIWVIVTVAVGNTALFTPVSIGG